MASSAENLGNSADKLIVVTGSSYLHDNAFQTTIHRKTKTTYKTSKRYGMWYVGFCLVGVGLGFFSLPVLILSGLPLWNCLLIPAAFLLFGIAVQQYGNARAPKVTTTKTSTQRSIKDVNFYNGLKGEVKIEHILSSFLNSEWTLYKNVLLQSRNDDIDAILVGPSGIFVLEVKAFSGNYRYDGKQWQYQTKRKNWVAPDKNPMEQMVANRNRVYRHLKAKTFELPVQGRLVWAGSGFVKATGHRNELWFAKDDAQWIKADVTKRRPLDASKIEQVHAELTRLCRAAQSPPAIPKMPF